jgi:hypothetical protein
MNCLFDPFGLVCHADLFYAVLRLNGTGSSQTAVMKERTVWTVLSGPTGTTTTKSLTVSLGQNDLGTMVNRSESTRGTGLVHPRDRESPGHSAYHDFSLERVVGRCRAVGSLARHVKRKGSATVERKKQNANQRRQKRKSAIDYSGSLALNTTDALNASYRIAGTDKTKPNIRLTCWEGRRPCNVRCKAVIVQTSIRHCVGHHYIGFFRGRGQNFQRWRVAGRRILYSLVLTLACDPVERVEWCVRRHRVW